MKKILKKRYFVWSTSLLLIFFFSLNGKVSAQIDGRQTINFPNEEKAVETAKATVLAYEAGNWDVLRELIDKDAQIFNLGNYDSLSIDQTIEYWKKGRQAATPVLEKDGVWLGVVLPDGPREGNWVLHWGNNTLTYPNGETISFPYHVAFKFEQDKIDEVHFYYDNNRIIRALGFAIDPPLEENAGDDAAENNEN